MKRYALAFGLLLGGVVISMVALRGDFNTVTKITAFGVSVVMAIYAILLYSNKKLDQMALRTPEMPKVQGPNFEWPESIQDDIETLSKGRVNGALLMAAASSIALFFVIHFIQRWNKWGASWGAFNVIFIAIVAAVVVIFLVTGTDWFQDQNFYTPGWVFLIPIVALVLSVWLGIYMTEPMELGGMSAYQASTQQAEQREPYDFNRSRAYYYFYSSPTSSSSSSSSSGFSAPSCSGKSCNGYLIVILIILALVLVIGSAFIAHFWVMSSIILLTVMALITIHDLRVVEPKYGFSRARW